MDRKGGSYSPISFLPLYLILPLYIKDVAVGDFT